MSEFNENHASHWQRFSDINLAYMQDLYDQYTEDPTSVDLEWRQYFDTYGPPPDMSAVVEDDNSGMAVRQEVRQGQHSASSSMSSLEANQSQRLQRSVSRELRTVVAASQLVNMIRNYAHLSADVYPYPVKPDGDSRWLDPATYHLSREELESIPAEVIWENAPQETKNAWEAIQQLILIYSKSTSYQFTHVNDQEEREWLMKKVEVGKIPRTFSDEERLDLLYRLIEVEEFENYLQRNFIGQKRFSIEGLDTLVPILDEIVHRSVMRRETDHVMVGMAHRGRLNVLAHVFGKPYETIFSEFHHSPNIELIPSEGSMGINYGWTGDVKYHLGANRAIPREGKEVRQVRLTLANNPSHLEFVNPIVQGFTRAVQEERSSSGFPRQDVDKAVAVLIHGDASFPGEGVVAETLNLSNIRGYRVGGTIHIVANNNLGFTTGSIDARSTKYASDLVKGFEVPIVHVNADDPEACLAVASLAYEYRMKFHKDFLIELVGYRRYGHNESDDPMTTQPGMYTKIQQHPTVATLYANKLHKKGVIQEVLVDEWRQAIRRKLDEAFDQMKSGQKPHEDGDDRTRPQSLDEHISQVNEAIERIDTTVPIERLREINSDLLRFPDHFKVYPKLARILLRRADALNEGNTVDWALAETLAFGSILMDGTAIRLTGQDTERGTFAHRNMVLHDIEDNRTYIPLHHIGQAKASFAIHNSALSEIGVLGFEYGYNVISPSTMVLWEAQFGDFANTAQVIIDQFLSAGKAKWGQLSGLVMLLPHGYEGQGPEHSSARLERFLQLSAENNWFVCNPTSASQYFHLLRRQAALLATDQIRPLIVMTPKSLLRHPQTSSPASQFSAGRFETVLGRPLDDIAAASIERLILCSGKVAIDVEGKLAELDELTQRKVYVARVEELYPFPDQRLSELRDRLPNVREWVWVQEEPANMGAWSYMETRLPKVAGDIAVRYVGRPERSSTAEGYPDTHQVEQQRIVREALAF